jgi:hypothetical protein
VLVGNFPQINDVTIFSRPPSGTAKTFLINRCHYLGREESYFYASSLRATIHSAMRGLRQLSCVTFESAKEPINDILWQCRFASSVNEHTIHRKPLVHHVKCARKAKSQAIRISPKLSIRIRCLISSARLSPTFTRLKLSNRRNICVKV